MIRNYGKLYTSPFPNRIRFDGQLLLKESVFFPVTVTSLHFESFEFRHYYGVPW